MPEGSEGPLDLSLIDDQARAPAAAPLVTRVVGSAPPVVTDSDARLAQQPPLERLVEVANLPPEDLAAANASAARVDFRKTGTLLAHGDGVLAGIADASRELLTGVRLGDAGAVGQIAAAVIDGGENSAHQRPSSGRFRRCTEAARTSRSTDGRGFRRPSGL